MHRTFLLVLFVTLAASWSAQVLAAEDFVMCGNTQINVSLGTSRGGTPITDFVVTIQNSDRKKTINYSSKNDFLALRCQSDKDGRKLLAINHNCSGSECAEANWGIVNLDTFEILLQPDQRWQGNHDKAESILGIKLRPFSCDNFKGVQTNGEYCYCVQEK